MNIRTALKIALFSFLSSLVCTIGYFITGIDYLLIGMEALWFVSFLCVIFWVCQKIYKSTKHNIINICIVASAAFATYCGIQSSIQGISSDEISLLSITYWYLFILFTLVCVASIIALLAALIFYPAKPKSETTIQQAWLCTCGKTNDGNFCQQCGAPRVPMHKTEQKDAEEMPTKDGEEEADS